MIKTLTYYYRLAMYKLSLEGEDSDDTYRGRIVFHSGKSKECFAMTDIDEDYPTIQNVKLSAKQQKLKDRELEKLKALKAKAKEERAQYRAENNKRSFFWFKKKTAEANPH